MKLLRQIVQESEKKGVAVGHFNISDIVALRAIFDAAREAELPVIIGVSEGEREFIGVRQAAALVRSLREEHGWPIFLNADHTHSLEKVKEAAEAGFDAVLFDGGKLSWEENLRQTAEAVKVAKKINKEISVEGEIGYIGSSSSIWKELPEGAAIRPEDLTTPEQAKEFTEKTGVDMLAPAVGNIHGMMAGAKNPALDVARIGAIKKAASAQLVLHGGSGVADDDFRAAIKAGIGVIHINTEIRVAWRRGLEEGLKNNPEEIAPYKILPSAEAAIKKIVLERLKLFSGIR